MESQKPETLRSRVLGQEAVFAQLDRTLAAGRLAHAYLFLGPAGVGKTRTALAWAETLLVPDRDPIATKKIARLSHPDLHLLFPMARDDAADQERIGELLTEYAKDPAAKLGGPDGSTIGIDRVRTLKEQVALARVEAPRRVVIWSDAGKLTEQAAHSALKLVEEPPADTVHILCVPETSQILPTLVSRCQRVRIRSLPTGEIAHQLEVRGVAAPAARLLASLSGGSLGRALQSRNEDLLALRDQALRLFAAEGSTPAAIAQRVEAAGRGWDLPRARRMVELLLMWYHDLLWRRSNLPRTGLIHADRSPQIDQEAARISVREARRRLGILEELLESIEQRVNPTLALQAALVRIARGHEAGEPLLAG